ncbi:hypothetical protein L226DRAFT_176220 [Lentinus tigrinus ALCF2SS1-7]|uniref:uncharacterized protein n=1 Tax=Lentinus tigrinus ALCF2SS1-7 TaxID=1328758 RepID=UPI001165DF20|nr:hypothetical protein L226DRAFT_176220 [Lentinus tigrinus ALCF2SS1-7]
MSVCAGQRAGCTDIPRRRAAGDAITAGDVYSIQESVYTVIFDILLSSRIVDRGIERRCDQAAQRLKKKDHATEKIRPCIAMSDGISSATPLVCLTASWEQTPLADLPRLFRHFSIPIHRNRIISDNSNHYHSSPEWDIENAYVLAWSFESTRPLVNRWPGRETGTPPDQPYVFGNTTLKRIVSDCKYKQKEWLAMCSEDPNFAVECARECLVSLQ